MVQKNQHKNLINQKIILISFLYLCLDLVLNKVQLRITFQLNVKLALEKN